MWVQCNPYFILYDFLTLFLRWVDCVPWSAIHVHAFWRTYLLILILTAHVHHQHRTGHCEQQLGPSISIELPNKHSLKKGQNVKIWKSGYQTRRHQPLGISNSEGRVKHPSDVKFYFITQTIHTSNLQISPVILWNMKGRYTLPVSTYTSHSKYTPSGRWFRRSLQPCSCPVPKAPTWPSGNDPPLLRQSRWCIFRRTPSTFRGPFGLDRREYSESRSRSISWNLSFWWMAQMEETLWHKFTQHPDLKDRLLSTGDAELIAVSDDSCARL